MGQPLINFRIIFLGSLMLFAMGFLVFSLHERQVVEHEKWTGRLLRGSQLLVRIPATRGEIRDRNGIVLVENRPSFKVDFYLPDIVTSYSRDHGRAPRHEYQAADVHGNMKEFSEEDIVSIVNQSVIPRLQDLEVARDYNAASLRNHYRQRRYVPYTYAQDIDFETMARLAERSLSVPGVDALSPKPVRHYVYGALACHILGYVGPHPNIASEPDIRDYSAAGYQPDDIGVAQVEQMMDSYLRGKPGRRVLQRNLRNVIEGEVAREEPEQGHNVFLTIDARIQSIAEQAMRRVGRGAAVVIDPKNGDVLAMVSVPSFDPNSFIPNISPNNWKALTTDPTGPLTNRALQPYAPGSTYKIPIALAGMQKGLGARTSFSCGGSMMFGNRPMRCWNTGGHGSLSLVPAIMRSCNVYFYRYGIATGEENIFQMGQLLGLGQLSGLGLTGENPGILPGKEWLEENYPNDRWRDGYTANTSIGQGFVLATPMQMAMVTATVANGGISYYPRLVDRVVAQDGTVIKQDPPMVRGFLSDLGVSEEQVEVVRNGMLQVTEGAGGTAGRAKIRGVQLAGKTGTAQIWRRNQAGVRLSDNHVWFIAFAPYDNPRYAVCVVVGNGRAGGSVAAPLASKIIEESLALERGHQIELAKLEPAMGNFAAYDSITFSDRPISHSIDLGEDAETVDHIESAFSEQPTAPATAAPAPQIATESDEEGQVGREPRQRGVLRNFFESSPEDAPTRTRRPGRPGR
ncbi:MAG: penicillin-binding protein 2 [Verrucomicrobiales bacterium]